MPRPGGMRNKRGAKQKAAYKEKGKQIAETHHAEVCLIRPPQWLAHDSARGLPCVASL